MAHHGGVDQHEGRLGDQRAERGDGKREHLPVEGGQAVSSR